jgi:starch synthase
VRNDARSIKALLAHPGTQHSLHLARELDCRANLHAFYTGIVYRSHGSLATLASKISPAVRKHLANRTVELGVSSALHRKSLIELIAQVRLRRGMDEQEVMHRRNEAFQRSIPDSVLQKADAVIGVDTASWILADRSKKLGRPFLLDQSIGHPDAKQAMHDLMQRRFPGWTEGFEQRRPEVRMAEIKEQLDATVIIAASSFTKQTLIEHGIPSEKVRVIPYGVDCRRFAPQRSTTARPFRFAFVGTLTARKGIPLLLQAWRQLAASGAELWLIGPASERARTLIPEVSGLNCFGAVPQAHIPQLLQQCDVFVFPSFFEGFGLVLLEAMACGLPVITTTATAGPDIITQDQDGWILDPGDLDTLISAMRFCLENPDRVTEMGANARRTAERFSWDAYGDRWVKILRDVIG